MVWACRPNCTRECVACGRLCVYIFDLTCYLLSSKSVKEEKWQRDTGCPERRGPQRWYRHSSGQFIGRLREWGQLHLESLSIFWLLKIDNWIWSLTPSRSLSYSCLLVGPTTGRVPPVFPGTFVSVTVVFAQLLVAFWRLSWCCRAVAAIKYFGSCSGEIICRFQAFGEGRNNAQVKSSSTLLVFLKWNQYNSP